MLPLLFTGCAQREAAQPAPPAPAPVTWNKSLGLASLTAIDERLSAPWEDKIPVRHNGKRTTVASCKALLDIRKDRVEPANAQAEAVLEARGIECLAINALRSARAAAPADLQLTAKTVPPELGPVVSGDDEKAVAAAAGKSWLDFDPSIKAEQSADGALIVRSEGYITEVTELARGDFSGSGRQEILVRTASAATEGTLRSARLLLLGRETNQQPVLKVVKRYR